ncbi:MAG: hypothetical protein WCO69_04545 [Candidatus Omnitrophota bacterium]
MSEPLKCSHFHEDGKQCGAFALTGKALCFSHDPESREAKLEAVVKGGQTKAKRVTEPLTPVGIKVPQDVVTLLIQTIGELRSGEVDQKMATTIGFLSGQLLRAFEFARNTHRMDIIEATGGIAPPRQMFRGI